MTDRTGLRSISTFRPVIGQQPHQPLLRSSAVLSRPAHRRNERFRTSIVAHSGLAAHVRRHARLAGQSTPHGSALHRGAPLGLPLILRRVINRRRRQAATMGPTWPVSEPQAHGTAAPSFDLGAIAAVDDAASTYTYAPFLNAIDGARASIEEIPALGQRSGEAKALTPPPLSSMLMRHTEFLGQDVLPQMPASHSPVAHETTLRANARLAWPEPMARPLRRLTVERGGRPGTTIAYGESLSSRGIDGPDQWAGRVTPHGGIMDSALLAEFSRSERSEIADDALGAPVSNRRVVARSVAPLHPQPQTLPFPIRRTGLATSRGIASRSPAGEHMAPAFSIARSVLEHYAPQVLPLPMRLVPLRDVTASRERSPAASPRVRFAASQEVHPGSIVGPSRSRQAALRQFLPVEAAPAAYVPTGARESLFEPFETGGVIGSGRRWLPFLFPQAPLRRLVHTRRPVDSPGLALRDFAIRDQAAGGGFDTVARGAFHPFAASSVFGSDLAATFDQTGMEQAGRASMPAGQLSHVARSFPTVEIGRAPLNHGLIKRPLAPRLAAHDEPFTATLRGMRATAISHILRRLPPTVAATSMTAATNVVQRSNQPPDAARPARSTGPNESTLFPEAISSSPLGLFSRSLATIMTESADAISAGPALSSELTRWFAARHTATPEDDLGGAAARARVAAPLPLFRTTRDVSHPGGPATRERVSEITSPAPLSEERLPPRAPRLPASLRGGPDVIARALADLLGEASGTAAPYAGTPPYRRVPAMSATLAPAFPVSTLPPPAPRHAATWPVATGSAVDSAMPDLTSEQDVGATGVSPFVARQVARAVNDLRLISAFPLRFTVARPLQAGRAGETLPAGASRPIQSGPFSAASARAMQRVGHLDRSPEALGRRVPEGVPSRPLRALQTTQRRSNDSDTREDTPFWTSWPFGDQEGAYRAVAGANAGAPVSFGPEFPGFPFLTRQPPMPLPMPTRPPVSTARSAQQFMQSDRRGPIERSAIRNVLRRLPGGPSTVRPFQGSPAGGLEAPFALPGFVHTVMRRQTLPGPSADRLGHGPMVFRSALPSAGEPTLAQRAGATEAMAQSSGQPLPPLVRRSMEHVFRMDLAQVRIHSGPQAARATDLVAARAMASGADVFLPGGVTDSPQGTDLPLLAHELTHVAHHFGRRPPAPSAAPLTLAHRTASTEQDAEQVERMVADTVRRQAATPSVPADLTLARKPAPVTIMRVDEPSPASTVNPSGPATTAATSPAQAVGTPTEQTKQDQQKLADHILYMLEQRLIVARERGGHRF